MLQKRSQSLLLPLLGSTAALGLAFCLGASPAEAAPFGMPDPITIYGEKVNFLYQFMMWAVIGIFVVVEVGLVYALWKYRRKPNENRAPEQWSHNTKLELVWTVIPFAILVAIAVPTLDALKYLANPPASASEQAKRSQEALPHPSYKKPESVAGKPHGGALAMPELAASPVANLELIDASAQVGGGPSTYAGHENDTITLEVIGHQFYWEYRYTDPWVNAAMNSTTGTKEDRFGAPLPIPAGKKVRVVLTAADVIHSWWVPALGGQQMTTPGNLSIFPLEIKLDVPEGSKDPKYNFEGACAYLCGPSHGLMAVHVRAVHPNDFLKWASAHQMNESPRRATVLANVGRVAQPPQSNEKPHGAAAAVAADIDPKLLAEKGKALYASACAGCHQPTGAGIPGVFPPLVKSDWVNGDDAKLVHAITKGVQGAITVNGVAYNGSMPAIGANLSDAEVAALTTYIRLNWENNGKAIQPSTVAKIR